MPENSGGDRNADAREESSASAPALRSWLTAGQPQADCLAAADLPALARKALRLSWPYAAGTAVVLIVAGAVFGGDGSWGNIPTWVLAITTLLAFAAAAFAALVTCELLRMAWQRDAAEAQERRQNEAARRRAQASRVAAWYGRWSSVVKGPGMAADRREWTRWGAILSNASDLPVYSVRVSFCVAVDPAAGGTWREGERYRGALRLVPPGEEHVEMPDHLRVEDAGGAEPAWLVAIEFTDAAGSRWVRDPGGRLEPASAAPPRQLAGDATAEDATAEDTTAEDTTAEDTTAEDTTADGAAAGDTAADGAAAGEPGPTRDSHAPGRQVRKIGFPQAVPGHSPDDNPHALASESL